jgi:protein-S-isoprenylcysteine O-methyltransferase Ste14
MQWSRGSGEPPKPRGIEAWLPALVLAITQIAVVVALVCFLIVAPPLQGRKGLPPGLIPAALLVAAVLALYLLWRVWRTAVAIRNILKNR